MRCIIFFFYDKDGIVDRYIFNMLDDLKDCAERIVFVCNGKLASESRNKLEPYGLDIITRENKGMDVCAYKEAMEYIGWDDIRTFDELVLMNYMLFPTSHSFRNMFSDMDGTKVDFWGAIECSSDVTETSKNVNLYFIAVRRSMLKSIEFKSYWADIPKIETYNDSSDYHQSRLINRFLEYGFSYSTYVPAEEPAGITDFLGYGNMKYLLENTNLPFIMREIFLFHPYRGDMSKSCSEASVEAFRYLNHCEGYDSDAIWENLLRTASQSEIMSAMQLNRVLPSAGTTYSGNANSSIGVMLYSPDFCYSERFIRHFDALPDNAEIHLFSPQKPSDKFSSMLSRFNCRYYSLDGNQDPASSVLEYFEKNGVNYDHILSLRMDINSSDNYSAAQRAFDTLLGSRGFVENVLIEFQNDQRLGLLFTPEGYSCNSKWAERKQEIIAAAKHLNVPIDEQTALPAPYSGMYWCSGKAMRKIVAIWRELPDIFRNKDKAGQVSVGDSIIGLIAQRAGYYSSWLYNADSAAAEIHDIYSALNTLTLCASHKNKK